MSYFFISCSLLTDIYLVFLGQNQLYGGYVVEKGSPTILRNYSTLDT